MFEYYETYYSVNLPQSKIDPHGLDIEPDTGLTLRIEGQFLDSFRDEIGFWQNDTFNLGFVHAEHFLKAANSKLNRHGYLNEL